MCEARRPYEMGEVDEMQRERSRMLQEWITEDVREGRRAETIQAHTRWRDEVMERRTLLFGRQGSFGKMPACIQHHLLRYGIGTQRISRRVLIQRDGTVQEVLSGKNEKLRLGAILVPPF